MKFKLTIREVDLLRYLFINKNKVIIRDQLLEEIWGESNYFVSQSLTVFINRIRKYLSNDSGINLKTIHRVGFILECE